MNLINLYAKEVGRHLPEKSRADIEREIRSLIEDTLEDESQKLGREPDEDMIVAVLLRLGPPEKMAASYLPPRYLIGPELYPHFITTLRIVLAVVTVLAALGIGASLGTQPESQQNIFELIGTVIGSMWSAIFNAAAVVVLIFAIIQFTSPTLKVESRTWDPRKMTAEPDPERVSVPGAVAEIVFNIVALIVLNFYSHWIGIASIVGGQWVHVPVLSEAFAWYLPWLSLVFIAEALHNVWLIARGSWTRPQRWISVSIAVANIILFGWMLTGPSIVNVSAVDLARLGWGLTPEQTLQISNGASTLVRFVIGLVMVLLMVDLGKQLFNLFRSRLPAPLVLDIK